MRPPTPHPTPASLLPTPGLHFLGVLRVFKGCQCVPTPPRALTAHTPPHPTPASPLPTPGLHFLGVLRVFKGCQCVPTPPRALTAHTPPHSGLATTHTWLAFPRCFESI